MQLVENADELDDSQSYVITIKTRLREHWWLRLLTCKADIATNTDVRGLLVLCDQDIEHTLLASSELIRVRVGAETAIVGVTAALFPPTARVPPFRFPFPA